MWVCLWWTKLLMESPLRFVCQKSHWVSSVWVGVFSVSRCDWILSFLLEGTWCDTGLPLADRLGFLGSSLGPSWSLPVACFPAFRMAVPFPRVFVPHRVVQACVAFPPGCFCGLATTDSAAVDTRVHVSFWIMVFFGYTPSSEIAVHHPIMF